MSSLETELARLQAELDASRRELEVARAEVIRLRNLLGLDRPVPKGPSDGRLFAPEPLPSTVEVVQGPITRLSSPAAKLALFRRLFVGRGDVFPVRWENRKTGRSGYAPACANEWRSGICKKMDTPPVKCSDCSNRLLNLRLPGS